MKKRRNIIIVVIILILLAAAVTVLSIINRPDELPETGTLTVTSGSEILHSFTVEDIRSLPYVEVQKEIVSSSFANDEGLFRGVPLRTLMKAAGADLEAVKQIVVRADDGFVSAFPADEITESDNIFLCYSKNGEPLGTRDEGGSGPLRIIVTEDPFGNRCAKYVCEIEAR